MMGVGHALYFQMTPLLGVLVGTAGTLLAIVLAVAIVVHRRNKLKRQRQSTQQQQQSQRPQEPPPSAGQGGAQQPLLSEGASPAAPPSQRSVSVTTKRPATQVLSQRSRGSARPSRPWEGPTCVPPSLPTAGTVPGVAGT